MAKRKKRERCGLSEKQAGSIKQDRISVLPDELLVHVLSRITLRGAVSTSKISKRWENLWKGIPCLRFDAPNIFDQKLSRREEQLRTPEFVNRVDSLVSQTCSRSLSISSLLVDYEIAEEAVSHIDQWVSFAVEHDVRELDLFFRGAGTISWSFPPQPASVNEKLSCMRKLRLTRVTIAPSFVGFKNLNLVVLTAVEVADKAFEDLLSNCSLLQSLFVSSAKKVTTIKIPETLSRLTFLSISYCESLLKVEVNAAYLLGLSYLGFGTTDFSFNNISKLEMLFLGRVDDVLCQLLSKNLQLENLFLHLDSFFDDYDIDFKKLQTLTNLKVMGMSNPHLSSGYAGVVNFLKAIPSLVKFVLQLKDPDFVAPKLEETSNEKFRHKCLREIELIGFSGGQWHIELACCLIESTAALEKLTIMPYDVTSYLDSSLSEEPDLERLASVRSCIGLISRKLPPTAKLELVE